MPEQRFVDLVAVTDPSELMTMHEYLPQRECRGCVGTGVRIKMIIVNGEFMGVMVTDEQCDCCSGTGQHYIVSDQ